MFRRLRSFAARRYRRDYKRMADQNQTNGQSSLPEGVPAEAEAFLNEMGYFEADRLRVGEQAPALELLTLREKTPVIIGARDAVRPVVLIFGSYT